MKIHPTPTRHHNITLRYDVVPNPKCLRRLPHIFAKVLELPFNSDADVTVQETTDSLRFVAVTDDIGDDIRTDTIQIYPGVTKIVIRGSNIFNFSMDELELDVWRFRLPASTLPELASAGYIDGELVVTVPKYVELDD